MNIREALESCGLEPDGACVERFEIYRRLLREWNARIDLTSVPDEETNERHFADSLLPLTVLPERLRGELADVGTGAGFPGLPLAICLKDLRVTLIDAQEKRCAFLRLCCDEMGLKNAEVRHMRAEDAGRDPLLRGRFDFAAARAVAPLNVLCEYLLPLVRTGGSAVCWKGPRAAEEMDDGAYAASLLGGGRPESYSIHAAMGERTVVLIPKKAPTPEKYPRKAGLPSRRPLMSKNSRNT